MKAINIMHTPLRLLQTNEWFQSASLDLLEALCDAMEYHEARDGEVLVKEGRKGAPIVLLHEGTLVRSKQLEGGQAHVIEEITKTGKLMGLVQCLEDSTAKSYCSIISQGFSKVWFIPGSKMRHIVTSEPAFSMSLMTALAREIRSGSKSLKGALKELKGMAQHDDTVEGDRSETFRVLCYDSNEWTSKAFADGLKNFALKNATVQNIEINHTEERLSIDSATNAAGYDAVCLFVNDNADARILKLISQLGVKLVLMRCAGYDRVDPKASLAYGMTVARVPAYSPHAVAEMAMALLLSVHRKIHKAVNRVRQGNFTLDAGLMGANLHGKTVGVMGTGRIGVALCEMLLGFGVELLCYSRSENDMVKTKGGTYVSQDALFRRSDVIFLTMPLVPATMHMINKETISKFKKGVTLINTSRGGLVDTKALLDGVRSGTIGGVGIDVYEREQKYFFQDWSARNIQDPILEALLGNHNVVLTAHQSFFTKEAVAEIVQTTLENIHDFLCGCTGVRHPNNCLPTKEPIKHKRHADIAKKVYKRRKVTPRSV